MISDSIFWKNDLLKLASKLERRLIQQRWSEKSFYTLEKEIFLGFFSIRKLIESKKISESMAKKTYQIYEFPKNKNTENIVPINTENDFEFGKMTKVYITISDLCNQFIHSYHFIPFIPEGKALIGFIFCSDYKRKTGIYMMTIFDIVDIYRQVGNNYPSTYSAKRINDQKVVTYVE